MNIINVIFIENNRVISVKNFISENEDKNIKDAREYFIEQAVVLGATEDDAIDYFDDGYFVSNFSLQVFGI